MFQRVLEQLFSKLMLSNAFQREETEKIPVRSSFPDHLSASSDKHYCAIVSLAAFILSLEVEKLMEND